MTYSLHELDSTSQENKSMYVCIHMCINAQYNSKVFTLSVRNSNSRCNLSEKSGFTLAITKNKPRKKFTKICINIYSVGAISFSQAKNLSHKLLEIFYIM